jgi:hypothetical protein
MQKKKSDTKEGKKCFSRSRYMGNESSKVYGFIEEREAQEKGEIS